MTRIFITALLTCTVLLFAACSTTTNNESSPPSFLPEDGKSWLAGDHHIHGKYSAKWDTETSPPTPILFGDAHYYTALNARMAAFHNLDWMVTTDHGGPNHSNVNLHHAYPELVDSRAAVPEVMQFYGMEFDTPGARHSTLIIPKSEKEEEHLYFIERNYNRREIYPDESPRDTQQFMLHALGAMKSLTPTPLLVVNHPARKAPALNEYQKVTPDKMRQWQDTAPDVLIGMTAIPGHQAATINPDGSIDTSAPRAEYFAYPTHGGTDQMSAIVGGVWDKLLSEGRKWTVTAVSDSHAHFTEGRTDFWPGEYAKTYVRASQDYQSVVDGLRQGEVFITMGDLIDALYVKVEQGSNAGHIGQNVEVEPNAPVQLTIAFRDPQTNNFNRQNPSVERVDVIYGEVTGEYSEQNTAPAKVIKRFYESDWQQEAGFSVMHLTLPAPDGPAYIRVRGTNRKHETEPQADEKGENPWDDLWFYSNPVYINTDMARSPADCNESVISGCNNDQL